MTCLGARSPGRSAFEPPLRRAARPARVASGGALQLRGLGAPRGAGGRRDVDWDLAYGECPGAIQIADP